MRWFSIIVLCLTTGCGLKYGYMRPCSANTDCQTDKGLVCARLTLGDATMSTGGYCTYRCNPTDTGTDTATGACPEIHCPLPRTDPTKCRPPHNAGGTACGQGIFLDSNDTGSVCLPA